MRPVDQLIRRLPIRTRVTLAFSGAMAVLLGVIGVVVYQHVAGQLDQTLAQGLRSRAGDISALIQRGDNRLAAPGRSVLDERGESFAQILTRDGRVLDASPKLPRDPLLPAADVARAAGRTKILTRPNPFERREPARLLATGVRVGGTRDVVVLVVGVGADDRNSQLASLALLLAVSGPIALLLASLAGFGVASAALAPVESMRRKADEITEESPGERLPVGGADDEVARLGVTLNGMLARLERAVDRERAFVADASHELRTPLGILKTEIELALRGGRTPAQLRDALASAGEEADRLVGLAGALLVIAGVDGGRLALAPAEIDSKSLLDGVSIRFKGRATQAGRRVVVDGEPVRFEADSLRIEQALDNLVDNALRHGAGTTRLSAVAIDDDVHLRVSDQGEGFPDAFLADAFERFSRADPGRARGGSGLGLSLVRLIARAHDGDAHAINRPDGGAQVSIVLPRNSAKSVT